MGQKRDKDGRAGRVHLNACKRNTNKPRIVSTIKKIIKKTNEINKIKKKNSVLGATLPKEEGGETGIRAAGRSTRSRYRDTKGVKNQRTKIKKNRG